MSRCLLHRSKLSEFKAWLDKEGIAYRDGKGFYQVLQICKDGTHWNCIYSRLDMPEHFTTDKNLDSLVARFCREKPSLNYEDELKIKLLNSVKAMSFQTGESVEDIVKFLTDDGGLTKLMLAYFCEGGKK